MFHHYKLTQKYTYSKKDSQIVGKAVWRRSTVSNYKKTDTSHNGKF
jgi:hypothetical protein